MQVNFKSLGGAALIVGIVAGVALLLTGPGYRVRIWSLQTAFSVMRWAAIAGIAGAALAAAALWRARGRDWMAAVALVIGLVVFGVPFTWQRIAAAAPPIHDISTDTANPPTFNAIVPHRKDAPNTLEYSQEAARLQRQAYTDITPLILELPSLQAFERALRVIRDLGWDVVAMNADTGIIEATDTTPFFGFKDDIVIRLTPLDGRTVVDVRSVSRVGRGDAGTNARRIRRFLEGMTQP